MRGALPGEIVRARATQKRGDGYAADVDAVLAASPDRVPPPCRHARECGGCALQHWSMDAYLAWKSGLLEAALRRAGFTPALAPIVRTAAGTRRRIDLAARRDGAALRLGLHAPRSPNIVDISECVVLHPTLVALLPALRATLQSLSALRREAAAVCNLLDSGPDLLLRTDADPTAQDRSRLAEFARTHGIPRIAVARGDAAPEIAAQSAAPRIRFASADVTPPPGAFLQASADGERAIVAAVLAGLPEKLPARARVADLYAGCGTLSFALAHAHCALLPARAMPPRWPHYGAPQMPPTSPAGSSAASRSRAAAAQRQGSCGFCRRRARSAACGCASADRATRRQQCCPRDLRQLQSGGIGARRGGAASAGYALIAATPIDQFLWSARLESVCVFAR